MAPSTNANVPILRGHDGHQTALRHVAARKITRDLHPVASFSVSNTDRQTTRLGGYILRRMAELGMRRPADVARATDVSDSTLSRIFDQPGYFPSQETLEKLADGLGVDRRALILFAYNIDDEDRPQESGIEIHPLAVEFSRMLHPDSPLTDEDRNALRVIIDRVIDPHRRDMRRRRPA